VKIIFPDQHHRKFLFKKKWVMQLVKHCREWSKLTLCKYFLSLTIFNLLSFINCIIIPRADIGVIGLAVMGQNLILNMDDHGFIVCAYNRTPDKVIEFMKNQAKNKNVSGLEDYF